MTNYERIKAMSVEEMAAFLISYADDFEPSCGWKTWLENEVEEDD